MNSLAVMALSGMFLGLHIIPGQIIPGQIPDRVILSATFSGPEIGFDFVRLECMRMRSLKEDSPRCWLDEVLLTGCDSGPAQVFPRHSEPQDIEISGNLLKREIIVETQGAGTRTTFQFKYFPSESRSAAYILTGATMIHRDSVTKLGFELQALKGKDATIRLPCAIRANGLWDRKDLP